MVVIPGKFQDILPLFTQVFHYCGMMGMMASRCWHCISPGSLLGPSWIDSWLLPGSTGNSEHTNG